MGINRKQVGQLLKDIHMEQIRSLNNVLSGDKEGITVGDTVVSSQDFEEDVLSDVVAGQLQSVLWDAVNNDQNRGIYRVRYLVVISNGI